MQKGIVELFKKKIIALFFIALFLVVIVFLLTTYNSKIDSETKRDKEIIISASQLIEQSLIVGNYQQAEKIKKIIELSTKAKLCLSFNGRSINEYLSCQFTNDDYFKMHELNIQNGRLEFFLQKNYFFNFFEGQVNLIIYLMILMLLILIIFWRELKKMSLLITRINLFLDDENLISTEKLKPLSFEEHKIRSKIISAIERENQLNIKINEFEKDEVFKLKVLQVAHDIKSPVGSLESLSIKEGISVDAVQLGILKTSIKRIKEVSDSLLLKYKQKEKEEKFCIAEELAEFVNLKKFEYTAKTHLNIVLKLDSRDAFVFANKDSFFRIMSNMINNSAEACSYSGEITISCTENDLNCIIEIKDNGAGIPLDIIKNIGVLGYTTKSNGNGIGISSAIKEIQNLGGNFEIKNNRGKGATVSITIPKIKNEIPIKATSPVVLLDNDELVRITWESRAKKENVELKTFSNSALLYEKINEFSLDTVFYIDSELDNEQGTKVAIKLNELGFKNIFMCSGYGEEKFSDLKFISGVIDKKPPF